MSAWSWEQQSSAADWMVIPTGEAGLGLQVSDLSHLKSFIWSVTTCLLQGLVGLQPRHLLHLFCSSGL